MPKRVAGDTHRDLYLIIFCEGIGSSIYRIFTVYLTLFTVMSMHVEGYNFFDKVKLVDI